MIGMMYHHEKELRQKYFADDRRGDADEFVAERRELVLPILNELKAWLETRPGKSCPKVRSGPLYPTRWICGHGSYGISIAHS